MLSTSPALRAPSPYQPEADPSSGGQRRGGLKKKETNYGFYQIFCRTS